MEDKYMKSLMKWFLLKQKQIELKLALYDLLEQSLSGIAENSGDLEQKLVHAIAEIIHNSNRQTATEES